MKRPLVELPTQTGPAYVDPDHVVAVVPCGLSGACSVWLLAGPDDRRSGPVVIVTQDTAETYLALFGRSGRPSADGKRS